MAKIKILEVIADSSLSGAPLHLLTLIKKLDRSQFLITLICPDGWLSREAKKLKIKTIIVPLEGFGDYNSIKKTRKMTEKINPDIIHLHGIRAGWLGVLAAKKYKKRIIYTEHLYTQSYHLNSRLREWIQLKGLSYIFKNVRAILTPSEAVKNFLIKKFRINRSKIMVVYNGLEDVKIEKVKAENKIGYIGSLNRQKGVGDLIKAFGWIKKKHPKTSLEIIGDGPLKNDLENKAKKISHRINFLGAKNNIWRYMNRWKIMVMPSRSESFGQAALGAAILSKPTVATRVGGLPEVIIDKQTGLLTEVNNPRSLAKAVNYLLEHEDEAEEMGERARFRFEKYFTAAKMVKKMEKIYQKFVYWRAKREKRKVIFASELSSR